jgi:D-sedoheptulose 7-phosphate isomerase
MASDRETIAAALRDAIRAHQRVADQDLAPVAAAADAMRAALAAGGKVLAFGNGGSAADAQHFAAELVGRLTAARADRRALAALALTTDASVLTSVANDFGYEQVFSRQVEALGSRGDVALGISTSGRSPNVQRGLDTARARGLRTVALTGGDGGPIGRASEIHINVPDASTARVQEVHRTLLHAICELVENSIGDG